MKLYYTPGACSLSPHIALIEAGQKFESEKVDLGTKKTESGKDFNTISPKSQVPTLQLDDGTILTEGPAIVQYIADKAPGSKLAPANGTLERYRLQEMLNYVSTEIHKNFAHLFNPKMPEEAKAIIRDTIGKRFDNITHILSKGQFLTGEQFTVADGYLFTCLGWCGYTGIDLAKWPTLKAYHERVASRPNVQAAMKAEGLIK